MLIIATAVFERLIHHAWCADTSQPTAPRLVVDAVVREGDCDGPLLMTVPMFRALCPAPAARAALAKLRAAGRIEAVDGVNHVRFVTWTFAEPE